MNVKQVLFSSLIMFVMFAPSGADASSVDTIKILPTDDAMAQLYDEDNIRDWSQARNFQGEIYREPLIDGDGNNAGKINVRSDKGTGRFRIDRVSKVFSLDALPENSNITKATLYLRKTTENSQGNIDVVVTSHQRVDVSKMQKEDWKIQHFGDKEFARGKLLQTDTHTAFELNADGLAYLNEGGQFLTLGLLTGFDFDDITPVGYVFSAGWSSSEAVGTESDPYLEIVYEEEGEPEQEYPLYTQIVAPVPPAAAEVTWAEDVMPCGKIRACGCAITSLVMAARASGVTEGVDGKDVHPGNLNAWLKDNDGYSGGALLWSRALDYFGKKDDETGAIATPLRLKQHNATTSEAIQAAASGPEHVIGFSDRVASGHYFVVSDYLAGTYGIRDPWYYETKTLDDVDNDQMYVFDYNNDLDKANILSITETAALSGFIEIVLASPAELRIEDEAEQVTGYDAMGNRYEIPTASYDAEEYVGDPAAEAPVEPHYIKRMMVTEAAGKYVLSVVGTGEGEYHLGISLRDSTGGVHDHEFDRPTSLGWIDRYRINVKTGAVEALPVQLEDMLGNIDREITDPLLSRFFRMWTEKLFGEIEAEKFTQAVQHLETFRTLLRAKAIESAVLAQMLERLEKELMTEPGVRLARVE